ncbi:hypothetical protein F5890DRAFT_542165 [Lentinula detonsa]|uniref:Secreted protein n=1 Tax=Lentinula detonsa TaxID=2804962 RepID=A0AA38PTG6_9AGAR|nr:hypothetical protein F5890DRAFT_542165 [Lentinula detonsa]
MHSRRAKGILILLWLGFHHLCETNHFCDGEVHPLTSFNNSRVTPHVRKITNRLEFTLSFVNYRRPARLLESLCRLFQSSAVY